MNSCKEFFLFTVWGIDEGAALEVEFKLFDDKDKAVEYFNKKVKVADYDNDPEFECAINDPWWKQYRSLDEGLSEINYEICLLKLND